MVEWNRFKPRIHVCIVLLHLLDRFTVFYGPFIFYGIGEACGILVGWHAKKVAFEEGGGAAQKKSRKKGGRAKFWDKKVEK